MSMFSRLKAKQTRTKPFIPATTPKKDVYDFIYFHSTSLK
jgi:hypothetical protein